MRRFVFSLVVLYAGCLGHCQLFSDKDQCPDHASAGCGPSCDCPRSGSLGAVQGRPCSDPGLSCSDGYDHAPGYPSSCVCDRFSNTWRCEQPPEVDLSIAPDQSSKLGCVDYRDCLLNCTASNDETCTANCAPNTKPTAIATYDAAVACAIEHCVGDGDAGTGKCLRDPDADGGMAALLNEDGTPLSSTDPGTGMKRCMLCLSDATAALSNDVCTNPNGSDCNPSACQTLVDACLLD